MAASDLAVLQDVKDWLNPGGGPQGTGADKMISRIITGISSAICASLGRNIIIPKTITERYDGVSNPRLLLRNWPVMSINQLIVNGVGIIGGSYPTTVNPGWPPSGDILSQWDGVPPGKPQILDLYPAYSQTGAPARSFCWGRQNVQVVYTAGYYVANEAQSVPGTPGPYVLSPLAPYGPWMIDIGVTYANGTALEAVPSAPVQGQYIAPAPGSGSEQNPPQYTFAAADMGAGILISYGFVPAELNTACIEWVAERIRYQGRIGMRSTSVSGQQTNAYDLSAIPKFVDGLINSYRNVVPFQNWS